MCMSSVVLSIVEREVLSTGVLLHVLLYRYVKCACDLLLLILKSFGPLIKVTVSTPVGAKVDLIREERCA